MTTKMNPAEAAAYIAEKAPHVLTSAATLQAYRQRKVGPKYYKGQGRTCRVTYTKKDIDIWLRPMMNRELQETQ